jgi:hypothetical protein
MSSLETRHHQMFPVLTAAQVETARRFASGPGRRFAADETVYDIGKQGGPAAAPMPIAEVMQIARRLDKLATAARILTIIGRKAAMEGRGHETDLHAGTLRFEAMGFAYPGRPARLEGVDFFGTAGGDGGFAGLPPAA